jgi:hypothetical protein
MIQGVTNIHKNTRYTYQNEIFTTHLVLDKLSILYTVCVTINSPQAIERPRFCIYTYKKSFPVRSLLEKIVPLGWISIRPDPQDKERAYYLLVESEGLKSCFQPVQCALCNHLMYTSVRMSSDNVIIGICGCSGVQIHKHAKCVADDIVQRKSCLCRLCNMLYTPENAVSIGDGLIISNALDCIGYTDHGEFQFPENIQQEISHVNWYKQFSPKTPNSQKYDRDRSMPLVLHDECMEWIENILNNDITVGVHYLTQNKSRKNVWILGFHMDDPDTIDWVTCLVSYDSSQRSWFMVFIQSIENNIIWALRSIRMILERSTISMYCYKTDTGILLCDFLFYFIFLHTIFLFLFLFLSNVFRFIETFRKTYALSGYAVYKIVESNKEHIITTETQDKEMQETKNKNIYFFASIYPSSSLHVSSINVISWIKNVTRTYNDKHNFFNGPYKNEID